MGAHVSVPMYRRSLPQRLALTAQRCTGCGRIHFPPVGRCADCGGEAFADLRLSGRGTLRTWTRLGAVGAPPEFAAQAEREGGFLVGLVDLEEGPRITGQLADFRGDPESGVRVAAVIRSLYCEEGVVRYGFKFRPAGDRS